jgi:hypothetical protein
VLGVGAHALKEVADVARRPDERIGRVFALEFDAKRGVVQVPFELFAHAPASCGERWIIPHLLELGKRGDLVAAAHVTKLDDRRDGSCGNDDKR